MAVQAFLAQTQEGLIEVFDLDFGAGGDADMREAL